MKRLFLIILISILCPLSCSNSKNENQNNKFSVGVFIPGVISGNPPYEMMANAARNLQTENTNISIKIFEAGYNQAEWEEKLTSFTANGNYDIIVTTNPALPELCDRIEKSFPKQKFIITDAYYTNNTNIATYMFNQYEQSYILGYAAGLINISELPNITPTDKIGFIVSQEYPLIVKHIIPGFLEGARLVNKNFKIDYRVIGNWYDATKTSELAASMIDGGVNVMDIIAGGAAIGAIKRVQNEHKYIVFHNIDEYDKAPGTILACGFIDQAKLTKEVILDAIKGEIDYGKAKVLGVKEGYVGLIENNNIYQKYMPNDIKKKLSDMIENIKSGKTALNTPSL